VFPSAVACHHARLSEQTFIQQTPSFSGEINGTGSGGQFLTSG